MLADLLIVMKAGIGTGRGPARREVLMTERVRAVCGSNKYVVCRQWARVLVMTTMCPITNNAFLAKVGGLAIGGMLSTLFIWHLVPSLIISDSILNFVHEGATRRPGGF